jgi:NAD(P)-dependent dehydrogenase (short-subunit alcohol dehydrogenase family)
MNKLGTCFSSRSFLITHHAGVRNTPESQTADGFETQFGVNHLAHFLLFQLLLPTLLSSSTPAFQSRVINVTSGAHARSSINFGNPNLNGIYDPRLAYSQSKTANILMANQIERLYGAKGVHGLSVHPGAILTNLQRYDYPSEEERRKRLESDPVLVKVLKSPEQGAATQVWAAVAPVWEGKGGKYLEDCREGFEADEPSLLKGGYKSFVFDEEAEERLWQVSCEMIGVESH